MPFRLCFGSWGDALKAAGFKVRGPMPPQVGRKPGSRNKRRYRIKTVHGYVDVFEPKHPLAKKNGYVLEHRMIAWDAGLMSDKILQVHHKNEIKTDNRLENLEVTTCAEHTSHHWRGKKRK